MRLPTVLLLLLLMLQFNGLQSQSCKRFCNNIPINYPFGIDDGCGAPQYRHMLNCSTSLFFTTPSGQYKVQSIDYNHKTLTIYDPSMSTCSILQPRHEFSMTDVQYAIIPPSSDTTFILVNCSVDSPILNHYASLCFNLSSAHSCDELYASCNSFRLFHLLTNKTTPCCFTRYDTLKFMNLNVLDCSHFTSVYDDVDGVGPLDWKYGMKLSYSVPETGCGKCLQSGGTCGFDTDSETMLCLCNSFVNSTEQCPSGSVRSIGTNAVVVSWLAYIAPMMVVTDSSINAPSFY